MIQYAPAQQKVVTDIYEHPFHIMTTYTQPVESRCGAVALGSMLSVAVPLDGVLEVLELLAWSRAAAVKVCLLNFCKCGLESNTSSMFV